MGHQLDHMQTICTLLQIDNHTNTSSLNFYRLDALPDRQLHGDNNLSPSPTVPIVPITNLHPFLTGLAPISTP